MKNYLPAALLPMLFASLLHAQVLPVDTRPSISTSGEATIYVTPDEVVLSLGIELYNVSLDRSKQTLDERSQSLLKAIKEAGVDDKDVQTSAVEVDLRYRSGERVQDVEGYVSRRSYTITVRDVSRVEAILDTALKNGANHLFGIDYQTTELRKHRDEARKLAIRAAKEKAQLLAGELEMTVGSPRTINEGSFWFSYGGSSTWWGARRSGLMMSQNIVQTVNSGPAIEGTMPLGQIAVQARVSVTFEMSKTE